MYDNYAVVSIILVVTHLQGMLLEVVIHYMIFLGFPNSGVQWTINLI